MVLTNWPTDGTETWWQNGDNYDDNVADVDDKEEEDNDGVVVVVV